MPPLFELQSDFRRFLTGETPEQLLRLVDGIGLEPDARLSIYRNNMLVTLTEALKATFPVVCRLVDDRFFAFAANAFIQRHPPSSPCLAEYGADYPDFLARFPPASGLDYLPDVASLEWLINRVVRAAAPDRGVRITAVLEARSDPAEVRLCLTDASAYFASSHPIDQIWQANQPGQDPGEITLRQGGVHLEVRGVGRLQIAALPAADWTFRRCLADGSTLGRAAEAALKVRSDFDIAAALGELFDANVVVEVF